MPAGAAGADLAHVEQKERDAIRKTHGWEGWRESSKFLKSYVILMLFLSLLQY
jgi:hypothetical protein